ncbi:MAG: respiratory nitrate reductase subunit gamma [Chloroflexota bacterium]|nr:MAG: respiratory nitrate reductase subunit gamma [Chloroflexota bacterium]
MTTNSLPGSSGISERVTNFIPSLKLFLSRLWDLFVNAVLQVRIWDSIYPGLMHALIFIGVTIQVLGTFVNLTQMPLFIPLLELPFPRGNGYLAFELVMDLAGVAILIGVIMALFRRLVLRPKIQETSWDDYYALIMLALIPIAGFTVEATRFVTTSPPWAPWSPVGNWLAGLMRSAGMTPETAIGLHRYLVYAHVILGLALAASIPFTKLRHLIYTPLNIFLKPRRKSSTLEKIEDIEETELLGVGKISEFTPQQLLSFDACVRCGRCEEACPVAFSGMAYSPREFIQAMRQLMQTNLVHPNGNGNQDEEILESQIPEETPWYCTTCGACLDRCPAFVNPIDEIVDLRRYQVLTTGKMPKSVGDVLRNMERQGNPWGMPPEGRISWTEGLEVRQLEPGDETDILLFLGCAYAFDERNKNVTRSIVRLLNESQVDYGILGLDEMCCGETSRRLGHEYLFQVMVEQNLEIFASIKYNRIVTPCPHCFNTLKNEYSQFGFQLEVQHLTEFLAEHFQKADFSPNGHGLEGRLTFHDSCYLGRYNQIYSQPRQLLSDAKIDLTEMSRKGEDSFCCGGGGGQMWMETDANTRINHRRLDDALKTNAEVVATACPYCLLMFDDAIRSKGLGDQIQVMDVAEVLVNQLGDDRER